MWVIYILFNVFNFKEYIIVSEITWFYARLGLIIIIKLSYHNTIDLLI